MLRRVERLDTTQPGEWDYLSWIDPVVEQAFERFAHHIRPVLAASSGGSHD